MPSMPEALIALALLLYAAAALRALRPAGGAPSLEPAWFGNPTPAVAAAREAPPGVLAVVWIAAGMNLWFGFAPGLPLGLAELAAAEFVERLP